MANLARNPDIDIHINSVPSCGLGIRRLSTRQRPVGVHGAGVAGICMLPDASRFNGIPAVC
jgi:hypothetical protein